MVQSLIGSEVDNGEYRIVERIGVGGMGAVYKAEQPAMNRMVAIKVLHSKFANRDDLVSRFRREARAMSQLSHPNTARVYKFGQLEDGAAYFVMDYMEGKNLAHEVREHGPMEADRALNIMIQVCGALDEAHRAGIIHRDLKPENIFLTVQGGTADFPKVLDFGLAKVSEKQMGRGSMMLTQEGMVFGTPEFMSPEQSMGEQLDRRSDIYSLGLILYELLTGKLPFDVTKPIDVMRAHVYDAPIKLNQRVPGKSFSPELEAAIDKALAKKKEDRYATAIEFADALKACMGDMASTAARRAMPSDPARPPQDGSRHGGQPAPGSPPARREDTEPAVVPVSRGPRIALGIAGAVILLLLGIWLGSTLR
ncbi:MAG: serine/threonine-protein kinase [Myxococcales bacterium]